MLRDRYDNPLSTSSAAARDAYVEAVDRFLAAEDGVEDLFRTATEADPGFALAHLHLARQYQASAQGAKVKKPLAAARAASVSTEQEAAHIDAMSLVLEGKGAAAYPKIRAHLETHPRDAMLAQTCVGVFGLIGFSGQPGREAEQLAYTASLLPHYGDDWWFLASHGWSQVEAGRHKDAERSFERARAQRPSSANIAHYESHLCYEVGERGEGYRYLTKWRSEYARSGLLHTHLAWHEALWALADGEADAMWRIYEADIAPGVAAGPSLNVLTDAAALLYRAELAGETVAAEKWRDVSAYAAQKFPNPGLAFADAHAALAYAMAGDGEALKQYIMDAKGPAADIVSSIASGCEALAAGDWSGAVEALAPAMADHARIGGSRAQRDLLEFAYAAALLRSGNAEEARRSLSLRRPISTPHNAVKGLH